MFSFGVMVYEVLQRYIMLSAVAVRGTYEELEAYCGRVADGYRPPLHNKWPASVVKLIQVSWGGSHPTASLTEHGKARQAKLALPRQGAHTLARRGCAVHSIHTYAFNAEHFTVIIDAMRCCPVPALPAGLLGSRTC